uniref:Uncharacterized protein n=1 Tax=Trichuris muris TaxID=70415 RepID=A0A5S6QCV6_TRIMR
MHYPKHLLTVVLLLTCAFRAFETEEAPFDSERYEIKSCLSSDLEEHERSSCRFYVLVIDAGSTGTRLELFEFSHDPRNAAVPCKLEKEKFVERKPGLSAYASSPHKAALVVTELLDEAKKSVPKLLWGHSPVSLKATAGFRLLPVASAGRLLREVERVLRSSPFLTGDEPAASLMDGTDEGIYGWFTLSYLLSHLDVVLGNREALSAAINRDLVAVALDLGGGSTQITFVPQHSFPILPTSFMKEIWLFGHRLQLYTHSYLGNGVMASRIRVLELAREAGKDVFRSTCFPRTVSFVWGFQGKEYQISGKENYSYSACYDEVRRHVDTSNVQKPPEISSHDLYAFGYFFDLALRANMVEEQGGMVELEDFLLAARRACSRYTDTLTSDDLLRWQCLDLTYVYSLLKDGYKLPNRQRISLIKKLRGMETSWALGAAYHLLNTYHEARVTRPVTNLRLWQIYPLIDLCTVCLFDLKRFVSACAYEWLQGFISLFNMLH